MEKVKMGITTIRSARGLLLLSFSVVPLVIALVIISTTFNLLGEMR